ncbi:DJ-1/PfpI family protein [Thiocystis violacea]|uniref:DJ-1/PfpI family protein n=1 Tax=Thiocystis violacea TaxID=13725 RepID=UPI00237A4274|nr:DJ-1/PfpI family protein [Thiocystis violacea]
MISADRVQGRRMTSYASVARELKAAGADYRDEEVATDRNLITSRQPEDIPAFIEQIFQTLRVGGEAG